MIKSYNNWRKLHNKILFSEVTFININLLQSDIMGTLNNNYGKSNQVQQHDGQKNYQNSNHRNPDNVRNATRDRQYKEYDETLTNDANYDLDSKKIKGDPEFDDKRENVGKNQ